MLCKRTRKQSKMVDNYIQTKRTQRIYHTENETNPTHPAAGHSTAQHSSSVFWLWCPNPSANHQRVQPFLERTPQTKQKNLQLPPTLVSFQLDTSMAPLLYFNRFLLMSLPSCQGALADGSLSFDLALVRLLVGSSSY